MDPITLAIIAGATKAGVGVWQRWKANKMARDSKGLDGQPVPLELQRNLSMAQRAAMEGMPEQSYQNQLNLINSQQAQSARGLMSRRNTAGQLNNVVANTNRATMGLNAADAQARRANQQGVLSARQIIAQAKQRSYEQEQQAIAALRGAGLQNITGGADTAMYGSIMAENGNDNNLVEKQKSDTYMPYRTNEESFAMMAPNGYKPRIPFVNKYRI